MHCKWMTNDMKPLNEFIHWGNTLKMDFTEKEFRSYRTAVMNIGRKKRIKFFRSNIFQNKSML